MFRLSLLLLILAAMPVCSQAPPTRFMLHGSMSPDIPSEEFLRFVEEIRPDVVFLGAFDQRLYALACPAGKKDAIDPAARLREWQVVAQRLHRKGIRLIGHMELCVVSDRPEDLEEGTGWFGFFDKHWKDPLLGPRPAKDARRLLARTHFPAKPGLKHQDALALCGCRVNTRALSNCLSHPGWRTIQKRMVQAALDHGVDGFITNRNYLDHCECAICQEEFRAWLERRIPRALWKEAFGFSSQAAEEKGLQCVRGTFRFPAQVPDALTLEKIRFVHQQAQSFFHEVYVEHGRSRRKDLFAAQWNHLAYFDELHLDKGHLPPNTRTTLAHALADERWGLPLSFWGKGEDLIWYCNWGTTQNTLLEKEYAGDTVLYAKYVQAMARGKRYVVNKYDFYRPRVMMAEAAALGYATNAIATPFRTEEDREVIGRYFQFLRRQETLFEDLSSHAELALVFPRRAIEEGDAAPLEYVEAAGRAMINRHLLFDMVLDEELPAVLRKGYKALIIAGPEYLTREEVEALLAHEKKGGKVMWLQVAPEDRLVPGMVAETAKKVVKRFDAGRFPGQAIAGVRAEPKKFILALAAGLGGMQSLTRAEAPWTVQMHAYRAPDQHRWVVHLVNYNHKEKAAGKSVVEREAPLSADPVVVHFHLPPGVQLKEARFYTPENDGATKLAFVQKDGLITLTTPPFLVYGIVELKGEKR